MQIPDYLIYEELERRKEKRDSGLERLELPLHRSDEYERHPREDEQEEESNRGVVIIDMNTGQESSD